jgi:hypothetical protein
MFLTAIGWVFAYWGLHQFAIIPRFPADHWDWLTADPEVLAYIKFWFRIHGVWTLANGLFFTLTAATAFRIGEAWSRWALAYLPVYIALLTVRAYWLVIITVPIILIAILALRAGWKNIATGGDTSSPGRGWMAFIPVALVIFYYACYNLFVIPALDPADPARGWDWLTTDPAAIDYFKFYFRTLGLHALSVGLLTLVTAALGLRRGSRTAWWILWIVPALFLAHIYFWPWLVAALAGLALLAGTGLAFSYPKLIRRQNE